MVAERRRYRERVLDRPRMLSLLHELQAGPGVVDTLYVGPSSGEVPGWAWLPPSALGSRTGLVLFTTSRGMTAIEPPFPPETDESERYAEGPNFGPLIDALEKRRTIGFILLRLGAYGLGVAEDGRLVMGKSGTRYVKGRHRAGGQSQRRFERNRQMWIEKLYDRVCAEASDRMRPYAPALDGLALGGDRHVIEGFMKRCAFARSLRDRAVAFNVPVDRPGERALRKCVSRAWSSRLLEVESSAV